MRVEKSPRDSMNSQKGKDILKNWKNWKKGNKKFQKKTVRKLKDK